MRPRRTQKRQSIWETGIWCYLAALPMGLGLLALTSALLGLLVLVSDLLPWMVTCVGAISLGASGYGMGLYGGFRRRRKGLWTGLVCGAMLALLLELAGLLWQGTLGGCGMPILLILASGIGGVIGVNQKHTRPPK